MKRSKVTNATQVIDDNLHEIARLRTALEQIHDIAATGTRNTAAWQEILEITNVTLTTQGRETGGVK